MFLFIGRHHGFVRLCSTFQGYTSLLHLQIQQAFKTSHGFSNTSWRRKRTRMEVGMGHTCATVSNVISMKALNVAYEGFVKNRYALVQRCSHIGCVLRW